MALSLGVIVFGQGIVPKRLWDEHWESVNLLPHSHHQSLVSISLPFVFFHSPFFFSAIGPSSTE
jgi:hypothetical protein